LRQKDMGRNSKCGHEFYLVERLTTDKFRENYNKQIILSMNILALKWILPDKFLRRKDRYDNEKKLNVIFYGVYHGDFMEFGLR
jgi:hypothetical protein